MNSRCGPRFRGTDTLVCAPVIAASPRVHAHSKSFVKARQVRPVGPPGYFSPILYSRMNMNRNRPNSMKTNEACTLYSRKNRVFSEAGARDGYSTMNPNRIARNLMKTNDWCALYSTMNRENFEDVFLAPSAATPLVLQTRSEATTINRLMKSVLEKGTCPGPAPHAGLSCLWGY